MTNDNVAVVRDKDGRRVWAARESKVVREGIAAGTYTEVTDAGASDADSGDGGNARPAGGGSDNRKRPARTRDSGDDTGIPGPA
ncbi:hypothetical protein ACWEV3_40965 [Saccharopolyspora sp. NPDC003752]